MLLMLVSTSIPVFQHTLYAQFNSVAVLALALIYRALWHKRYFTSNKLVAITCYTCNSAEAYRIAKGFKECGSKVVMGGPHVSYLADEALEFCDSVVIGEMEGIWKDVIKDYENGELKAKYMGGATQDYHKEVHQELLNSPPNVIKGFLETTRGCKFKCHFCTVPSLSDGSLRKKPVFEVVELIKKIKHKYKYVTFIDNNIYNDPGYAKELFKALKPLKIKWGTQCTIDIAKNDETLRLARESGCSALLIGFEISGKSEDKMLGGKLAMAEKYLQYAKKIKQMGIKIKAHYIFGFEHDNFKNLVGMWKFCLKLNPFVSVFSILTPLPGSQFYHDMLKENRIMNLNWRYYGLQSPVCKHKNMNFIHLTLFYRFIFLFFLFSTSKFGIILFLAIIGFLQL